MVNDKKNEKDIKNLYFVCKKYSDQHFFFCRVVYTVYLYTWFKITVFVLGIIQSNYNQVFSSSLFYDMSRT